MHWGSQLAFGFLLWLTASFLLIPNSSASIDKQPIQAATDADRKRIESFDQELQNASAVRAQVERINKLTLLGETRKAKGELLLSKSKVRLDLTETETASRDLLILGESQFWAVHYPPKALVGASVQVIRGKFNRAADPKSKIKGPKKGTARSGLLALFGSGGLLKSFSVTGVQVEKSGIFRYYLQPATEWVEAKRAMIELKETSSSASPASGPQVLMSSLKIWDFQDNESEYVLSGLTVEKRGSKSAMNEKQLKSQFEFVIPSGADVMNAD